MKVLYIAGCDRSGSTLLDRTLGSLHGVFSGGEIHQIFTRGLVRNELCGCGSSFRECEIWSRVTGMLGSLAQPDEAARMEDLKASVMRVRYIAPLLLGPWSEDFAQRLAAATHSLGKLYRSIRDVTGCDVIVDSSKHPGYAHLLLHVPDIDLRVIHLVRDSRGVGYSWRKTRRRPEVTWQVEYLDRPGAVKSCYLWNLAQLASETLRFTKAPYLRIFYEDFASDISASVARILEFMGLDTRDAELRIDGESLVLGTQHTLSGNPMRMDQGQVTVRLDDAWRSEMSRSQRVVTTLLTLPFLVRYRYLGRS